MIFDLTYISIAIASLILGLLLVLFIVRKTKKVRHKQIVGIQFILLIRDLITSTQKHRGWSAAYARGDQSVLGDLNALKQNMKHTSSRLEHNFPVTEFERWESYQDHWGRLSAHSEQLTLENTVKQHTQIVSNLLFLLEDIAEHYHLTVEHLSDFPNVGLLWRELLHVAEYIGQSRALGTGIATQQFCSSVEKIKLGFLHQKISEIANGTFNQLEQQKSKADSFTVSQKVSQAKQQIGQFCQIIKQELIDAEKIELDSKQYFSMATDAIQVINDIFDTEVNQIKDHFSR